MRGLSPSHRNAVRVARVGLLVAGIVITAVAFLGLVDAQLVVVHAAPWWWVGLIGMVAVVLGLGSPWDGRGPGD
jgi:hypothetical protein